MNTPKLRLDRVVLDTRKQPFHIDLCKATVSRSTIRSPRNSTGSYTFIANAGGTASFDRSMFIGGGAIAAIETNITISNSVIESLLGQPDEGALIATPNGSISVSYSTLFDAPLVCGNGTPVCNA